MALTRAEIELLIKARSEADGAFQKLSGQIKQVTGDAGTASQGMESLGGKTRITGTAAIATGVAFGQLADRLGRGLVSAFQSTIQAANQLDAGLIGLRSVATAFQQDAGAAEQAAKRLASDGLLSVGEAATSLKNLLAAGFGLPEAVKLVERFKDSAAFGRQAALGFGQAVSSATEGIKNGNSILVDNAGVTKNLSQILVEAGFAASDLSKASSDANIRMALFNGIVKETNPQLGDAARFLETAAGKQAQFSAQVEIAQQKIGKALQPALAATLGTLTPFIAAAGESANVLVPLAAAVGAVVTPLVAMRAAAALGIPSIGGLGSSMASTLAIFKGVSTLADARAGIQLVGEQAGLTFGKLGKLGSAFAVVSAAAAGWSLGRAISEAFALDEQIRKLTVSLGLYADLSEQTALAKQDVLNRAFASGAPKVLSYAGAIEFNNRVLVANTAVTNDSTGALRRKLEAQLAVGQITRDQFNEQIKAVEVEERHQAAIRNTAGLREALSGAEKKYRDEIKNTGLTVGQLQQAIKQNGDAFDAWAKQVGLSETTVDRLKSGLKDQTKALKDQDKAAREAAEAHKKYAEELEKAGITTNALVNEELRKLEKTLQTAAGISTPALATAVKALYEQFQQLEQRAKASGLAIDGIKLSFDSAAKSAGLITDGVRHFQQFIPAQAAVTEANRVNTDEVRKAIKAQEDLQKAYAEFGLKTPQQLRDVAAESARNYEILRGSGTATTAQLKTAYAQMIEDQRAATGRLPSVWQTEVFPAITRTVEQLNTAVQGTFAQMLLGAKGFKDGFVDIWDSIKASVTKILADLLGTFVNSFLKGVVGALSGQQGAFSSAFSGFLGGGARTPGFAGGAGLFGGFLGGGAPLNSPAIAQAGLGLPAGGAGISAGLAGLLGGVGAGAGGLGLGLLFQNLFGGAGLKSGLFGAGSGAATGALIGSIVPGLGTGIGALIGGASGLFGGLFGKSQGQKTNDVRDQFFSLFGSGGTGEGSGFLTVAAQLAKLSGAEGGGFGGGQLFKDLVSAKTLKDLEAAIAAVVAGLEKAKFATEALADASDEGLSDAADSAADLAKGVEGTADESDGVATLSRGFYNLRGDVERARDAVDDLREALRDLPGVPTGTRNSEIPIVEGGAAEGVYANRPGLVLFGEAGEAEVGGPKSFFKDVLASLGVGTGASGPGGGGVTVVPVVLFAQGAGGFDYGAINQHLASSAGISGNAFGLRELIEGLARNVFRQEMTKRG
jgi:hypothetical protein